MNNHSNHEHGKHGSHGAYSSQDMMYGTQSTHGTSMNSEKLDGVHCEVTNCVYNKNKSTCTAKKIKVGPQFAASSADTICDTFKPI